MILDNQNTLSKTIIDALRARSLDVPKLSELTGVSERYVLFLIEEKFSSLPAVPYVRGYLMKIAQVLNLDSESIWQAYLKDNAVLKRSGKADRMPENRFVTHGNTFKVLILTGMLLAVAVFSVIRIFYLYNPKLIFENLEQDVTIVKEPVFKFKGSIEPNYKLVLNNEEVFVNQNGSFEKEVVLEQGFNTFTFKAKQILGKEHIIIKQIFYQRENSFEDVGENLNK